jgi:2-phosphosulfolactate phosphatase
LPSAESVLIGAFLNASATARIARSNSATQNKGITIVQAGSRGEPSLDDLVCAELVKTMIENGVTQQTTLGVRSIVESLLYAVLSNTEHGRYLMQLGFDSDLRYCSRLDTTNVVPQLLRKQGMMPRIVRVADSDHK